MIHVVRIRKLQQDEAVMCVCVQVAEMHLKLGEAEAKVRISTGTTSL